MNQKFKFMNSIFKTENTFMILKSAADFQFDLSNNWDVKHDFNHIPGSAVKI
jgi:hypothetical protein